VKEGMSGCEECEGCEGMKNSDKCGGVEVEDDEKISRFVPASRDWK
jgi:hypothetical protein